MGTVIEFEPVAMATLRRRVAEVEEANQDLVAFARGHSGAVSAIHRAVLAMADADGFDQLVHIVTHHWPDMLGLDAVALAVVAGERGLRADASGMQPVDARFVERSIEGVERVTMRDVARGHPLFGPACALVRAEALVRIDAVGGGPAGLLALGQRRAQGIETRGGLELLIFLGQMLSRMMRRWPLP